MKTTIYQRVVDAIKCKPTDIAMMVGVGSEPEKVNVYGITLGLPNGILM